MVVYLLRLACCLATTNQPDTPPTFKASYTRFSHSSQFHASDLCRAIGQAAYDARVLDIINRFTCPKFTAILAVHGQAVLAGEISR